MSYAPASESASFQANLAWEHDRAMTLEKSALRAWTVAAVAITLAIVAVLAVFVQGPLRQVVGVPIVVDRTTGATTVEQRLSQETVPPQEALDKHNAAAFVRAREGYNWWWLQRDFDQVARMAVPSVFNDYNRLFDGDQALQKKIGSTQEWRINIIGVRLSPLGRQGNRGEAIVTYDRVVREVDRNLPDQTTRYVASLVYEYQPKVLAKEVDRIENPFGFVVSAYRSDPEVTPSDSKASGAGPGT